MRKLYLLSLLLIGGALSAQEICDNGIDDDGDQDIDLLDSDCICSNAGSSITADFEEFSCCPTNITFFVGDGYYCVNAEWNFASEATTDYFNTCGFLGGNGIVPAIPQPIPSGNGAVGFVSRQSDQYNEGIARCLDCTLIAGQSYDVSFFVGFNSGFGLVSSSPVEFALYGKTDCSNIPTSGFSCLEGLAGWVELATFTAVGNNGDWVATGGSFTAADDYTALAFSKSCGFVSGPDHHPTQLDYHFMDALEITGSFDGPGCGAPPPDITADLDGDCINGYTLTATPDDAVDYQWYLNGIAIAGATGNPWTIDPVVAGDYQVLATFADGECSISDPITFDPDLDVLNVDGITTEPDCFSENTGSIELTIDSPNAPFDIQWNTGSSDPILEDIGAGTYSVTVTDANGCIGVYSVTLDEPDPIIVDVDIQQPSGGEGGTVSIFPSGGTPDYQYDWSNGLSGSTETDLATGTYSVTITDANGCEEVIEFDIVDPLVVDVLVFQEICLDACDGSIELTVSGGLEPYFFEWNIAGNTDTQQGLCAGLYSYTVTDALGTTVSDFIEIDPGASFTVSIEEAGTRCNNAETADLLVTLNGGQSPFTYAWSTGAGTQDLIGITTGFYEVTVTDDLGCESVASYELLPVDPLEIIPFITDISCGAATGSIELIISGGEEPYDILWDDGQTGAQIFNLPTGDYSVEITDAQGCTLQEDFTIAEQAELAVSATLQDPNCPNNPDGTIDLTISGGASPISISWSNGDSGANIGDLGPGDYTVTVSDANACEEVATYSLVTQSSLTVNVDQTDVSCFGASDGLLVLTTNTSAPPLSYNWDTGDNTPTLGNLLAGNYSLTITDDLGCEYPSSYTILEPPLFEIDSIVQPNLCFGDSLGTIQIVPLSGGSFEALWSTGATGLELSAVPAGTYSVTVTQDATCEQLYEFTLVDNPALLVSVSEVLPACGASDGSFNLTASGGQGPYVYAWSTGGVEAALNDIATGSYSYTVTDALGCSYTEDLFLAEESSAVLSSTVVQPTCPGDSDGMVTLSLSGGAPPFNISWSNGSNGLIAADLAAGSYSANITDANGCTIFQAFDLVEQSSLSVDAMITEINCFDGSDGGIEVTASGSAPGFSYNWSTGSMESSISNVAEGNYELTITDNLGCEYLSSYDLAQPALYTIDSLITNNLCAGDSSASISILPVTPGTFDASWSNGQTGLSIGNLPEGTYTTTVTNERNCEQSYDFVITDEAPLVLTSSFDDPRCGLSNGAISLDVSGGVGPYSVDWSNGATGETLTDLAPGTYTATVRDANSCTIQETVNLSELSSLQVDADVIPVNCFGEETGGITINAISSGTTLNYNWSNGATDSNVTTLAAGNYFLTITDEFGCEYISDYEVTEPSLFQVDSTIVLNPCFGGSDASIAIIPQGPGQFTGAWNTGQSGLTIAGLNAGNYSVAVTNEAGCTQSYDFTIVDEVPALEASLDATDPTCGLPNGTISTTVTGGSAPYTYTWNNGANDSLLSDLSPGQYDLIMTDAEGCTIELSETLMPSTALTVIADLQDPLCNGANTGSITLESSAGTPPYQVSWSNGEAGTLLSEVGAGTYTAFITDAIGCELEQSFTLNEPEELSFNTEVSSAPCFGDVGNAVVTPSGGTPPYTVEWSTGNNGLSVELAAGVYTFVLMDTNDCQQNGQVEITEPNALQAEFVLVENPTTGLEDGFISATATGGTMPYTYNWSNGQGGESIDNLAAGPYTLTVTDANGCVSVINTTLPMPEPLGVAFDSQDNLCFSDCEGQINLTITGGQPPFSINWSDGQTTETAAGLCAGSYDVVVEDANGNVVSLSNLTIGAPDALVFSASVSAVSCIQVADGTISTTITGGTAPYNYAWSNNATTSDVSQLSAGTYSLTVTDANGCQDEQAYIILDYTPLQVNYTTEVTNCAWDQFQLQLIPPFSTEVTYLLNGERADFTPSGTLNGIGPGNYVFSYLEANGCEVPIANLNLLQEPPYSLFVDESTRTIEYGDNLTLDIQVTPESQLFLNNTISWSTLNPFECIRIFEDDCTEIFMSPTQSELVRLRFVDERGCETTFAIPIRVEIPDYVYVPNVFSPNNDGVNDFFTFFVTDFVRAVPQLQIFDRWGAVIYEDYDQDPTNLRFWDGRYRGQPVNAGVYVYTILLELVTGEEVLLSGDVTVVR